MPTYSNTNPPLALFPGDVGFSFNAEAFPANGTAGVSTSEILGAVSFTSDPSGAEVYVDDTLVGKSPITLNLKLGHHYVRMFAKDYKNWSEQFTIVTGPELRLTAVLEKAN